MTIIDVQWPEASCSRCGVSVVHDHKYGNHTHRHLCPHGKPCRQKMGGGAANCVQCRPNYVSPMIQREALLIELTAVDNLNDNQFALLLNKTITLIYSNEKDIAHGLDVSRSTIARWRGGRNIPHPSIRKHVYDYLIKITKFKLGKETND